MVAYIAPGMCCKLCFRATLIILQLPWYSIKSTRRDKHIASARRTFPPADNKRSSSDRIEITVNYLFPLILCSYFAKNRYVSVFEQCKGL